MQKNKASSQKTIKVIMALVSLLLLFALTFAFSSCAEREDLVPGELEVTLDSRTLKAGVIDDDTTIEIAIVPDETMLSTLDACDGKIYLLELPAGATTLSGNITEIDSEKPGNVVSFSIPLIKSNGVRPRIYSSFFVAAKDQNGNYIALCERKYVSLNLLSSSSADSEQKADKNSDSGKSTSIKGLAIDSLAAASKLSPSIALIDVDLDDLICFSYTDKAFQTQYIFNGTSRFLCSKELEAIDEKVDFCASRGMKIYLRFILTNRDSILAPDGLTDADAAAEAENFPIDFSDVSVAEYMCGLFDFFAGRYNGKVDSWILGDRADDAASHALPADTDKEKYAESYLAGLRIADSALRSKNPNGKVYASVGSNLQAASLLEGSASVTVKQFISYLTEGSKAGGDFPWGVSISFGEISGKVWETDDSQKDGMILSPANIGEIYDLLGNPGNLYNGSVRDIIIADLAFSDKDSDAALSYAYSYIYFEKSKNISAFIYTGSLDESEEIYDIYKYIDTADAQEVLTVPKNTIPGFADALSLVLRDRVEIPFVTLPETEPIETDDRKYDLKYSAAFNSGSFGGFEPIGGARLTLAFSELYGGNILRAESEEKVFGICSSIDASAFDGAKYLKLGVSVSKEREGDSRILTFRFVRAGSYIGEASISFVCDEWKTLYLDVSSISDLIADCGGEVGFEICCEGADVICFDSMELIAEHDGSAALIVTYIAIAAFIILIVLAVFLNMKKKKLKKERRDFAEKYDKEH